MKKRLIACFLLLITIFAALVPDTNVSAKKKKYTTITMPMANYKEDLILKELLKNYKHTTKKSGKNTLIKLKTKDVKTCLATMKKDLKATVKETTKDGNIKKITYNNNLTTLKIYLKSNKFESIDNLSLLGVYLVIPYYQLLNGVKYSKIDCNVTVYNKKGKVVKHSGLSDILN